MKLIIYNCENTRMKDPSKGRRSIRFNRVNGSIYISVALVKDLGITEADQIEFANDEENPKEWYLRKTSNKQGFPLQFNKGGTRMVSKFVSKAVLDSVKLKDSSATFLVSKEAVETENGSFYKILVTCPIVSGYKPKVAK